MNHTGHAPEHGWAILVEYDKILLFKGRGLSGLVLSF